MSDVDNCVVIGGGVAGLWAAWALSQRGVTVTVLEGGRVGSGASWGNAGWICPAQAGPLPEPGIVGVGLKDLLKRDSSLHFTPAAAVRMAPWIARFASACRPRVHQRGVLALSQLGYPSFALLEQLGLDEHVDKTGLLAISRDPDDITAFLERIRPLTGYGQEIGDVLTGDAVQDVEPVVPAGNVAVLVSNHWQVVPHTYNAALLDAVRAAGVRVIENRPVTGFDVRDGHAAAVLSGGDRYAADAVVIATGSTSHRLTRQLGHPVPVVGGKGYSLDVEPGRMPRQAIDSLDAHLALSPMGDTLRLVGGMDFSNAPDHVPHRRVESMRRAATRLIGPWTRESRPWAGLRPVAPDGLPLIGRLAPRSNVFVATGYSMLGMTISPAAGVVLAEAVVTGDDGSSGPFSPQRFRIRRSRTSSDLTNVVPGLR